MAATSEHDPRLGAPAGLRLAPAPLGGAPLEAPEPTLVYYDVPGESLTAAGIALRRRSEDGGAHWRLRLPAGYSCLELEAEGGWAQPPAELLALLQAHLRRGPLEPIVEVRTRESNDVELKIELRDRGSAEIAPAASSPLEMLRGRLGVQLREIERHDPGTRLGRDPESLHDMRVAVRRLRALLRAGRKLVAGDTTELDGRLKQLGLILGEVRDLDVLLAHLESEAAELGREDEQEAAPLLASLRTERSCSRSRLLAALRSEAYLALLDDTARTIDQLEAGESAATLDDLVDQASAKLRRAVRRLPETPEDDELHAVRKKGKRARYAAELAGRAELVKRAKKLQDVLGEHQDAVVAAERLRGLAAAAAARQALVAGRLVEREEERRIGARADWPKTWRKLRETI